MEQKINYKIAVYCTNHKVESGEKNQPEEVKQDIYAILRYKTIQIHITLVIKVTHPIPNLVSA